MITLKFNKDDEGHFNNSKDAIEYFNKTIFDDETSIEVTLYDISDKDAFHMTHEVYQAIKEYNKGKNMDEQILPTNPFRFRGIVGCLGVQCYSIGLGTYKRNHNLLALFTGYNDLVLDSSNEKIEIVPSMKALSSLALMAQMMK